MELGTIIFSWQRGRSVKRPFYGTKYFQFEHQVAS